jgi:hypothetical protein
MITNEQYWNVLSRIDSDTRKSLTRRQGKVVSGSERHLIIRGEVPYNPLQIMREASRLAVNAGCEDADMWGLDNDGAYIGDPTDMYGLSFFSPRIPDVDQGDADKYAALNVLAQVCEYIKKEN